MFKSLLSTRRLPPYAGIFLGKPSASKSGFIFTISAQENSILASKVVCIKT